MILVVVVVGSVINSTSNNLKDKKTPKKKNQALTQDPMQGGYPPGADRKGL